MKLKSAIPPSRQGKKQVIAYVEPELAEAVEQQEEQDSVSKQEVVARAINAVLKAHGKDPILDLGHHRLVRRKKGKSKARITDHTPHCRRGRRGVGGWFEHRKVQRLGEFAREIDMSTQAILEMGLKHVTGVQKLTRQLHETTEESVT